MWNMHVITSIVVDIIDIDSSWTVGTVGYGGIVVLRRCRMNELRNMLKISQKLGPRTQGKDFIVVQCYCDFEGHGRASETWEEHWRLTLPLIQHHWKRNDGKWAKGSIGIRKSFHGHTFDEVVAKAKVFVRDIGNDLEWLEK
jgi:hypothetical protein